MIKRIKKNAVKLLFNLGICKNILKKKIRGLKSASNTIAFRFCLLLAKNS